MAGLADCRQCVELISHEFTKKVGEIPDQDLATTLLALFNHILKELETARQENANLIENVRILQNKVRGREELITQLEADMREWESIQKQNGEMIESLFSMVDPAVDVQSSRCSDERTSQMQQQFIDFISRVTVETMKEIMAQYSANLPSW